MKVDLATVPDENADQDIRQRGLRLQPFPHVRHPYY
jgi:hypothetical protein